MKKKDRSPWVSKRRAAHDAERTAAGALAGAALGAAAGPPGALAGAVFGGVVGALAGVALENASLESSEHERKLDEEIGVIGGEIGAPNLAHPKAIVGAYSSASAGGGSSSDSTPAEGPISEPE